MIIFLTGDGHPTGAIRNPPASRQVCSAEPEALDPRYSAPLQAIIFGLLQCLGWAPEDGEG